MSFYHCAVISALIGRFNLLKMWLWFQQRLIKVPSLCPTSPRQADSNYIWSSLCVHNGNVTKQTSLNTNVLIVERVVGGNNFPKCNTAAMNYVKQTEQETCARHKCGEEETPSKKKSVAGNMVFLSSCQERVQKTSEKWNQH